MKKKKILVGVCAGIAAYKSAYLVRLLVAGGCEVRVMMTPQAAQFVTPLTFQTLSANPVYLDMFSLYQEKIPHTSLAQWADLCVIAPLSANTLSKIATGICDNLLTTVVCALGKRTKVLCVPAMNEQMWENPFIQENCTRLKDVRRFFFMEPARGELACGSWGQGRMQEADQIYKKVINLTKSK